MPAVQRLAAEAQASQQVECTSCEAVLALSTKSRELMRWDRSGEK